ncbi:hypothetical protein FRB95_006588 [Tulasnella sp. JGI-2019a]|nr:hypothetical protein FRB95_006588 [Tulasnella sp. JGI-2019a]
MEFTSTQASQQELCEDIIEWYEEYEDIFYQQSAQHLPTCVVTVYAWLHAVDFMEETGPLWSYWCWVMEWYCS